MLWVVIGLPLEDGEGSVELFEEDESDHLMGECHMAEAEEVVGSGVDLGREAVGAADGEGE